MNKGYSDGRFCDMREGCLWNIIRNERYFINYSGTDSEEILFL